ncbi:MAG: hypothetical protein CL694_04670 [Chloroflexi bacterium]|nr:hypothetical protein [Chloroflexota bacterium]HAL46714.1 hypothetical protein [Dehalococcoidia bacterium]
MTAVLPLQGVRIVELGQLIAVPFAVKLLSDMGAQVIRIESCGRLDNYRANSFYDHDSSGEYWNRAVNFYDQNRNKMSLTLDMTTTEAQGTLRELIAVSDVFAENFTPRVVRNFGLEYEDLRAIRPDIIMVSSTGYGYSGPWSNFGAIGYGTEAASGLAHATGYEGGPPMLPEIPYADYTAAEHTVFAVAAALAVRARTGQGQFIDVSQTQTMSAVAPEVLMDYAVNGRMMERLGNQARGFAPQGCYRCSGEDRWIAISAPTDAHWRALCVTLGDPEWARDERFVDSQSRWQNRLELDRLIGQQTVAWEHRELERVLQSRRVPAGAVLDGKELLFDPHLAERGYYEVVNHDPSTGMPPLPYTTRPWVFSETPGSIRRPAPLLGEHNRWTLAEVLGKTEAQVADLEQAGIIGYAPVNHSPPPAPIPETLIRQGRAIGHEPDFKEQVRGAFSPDS